MKEAIIIGLILSVTTSLLNVIKSYSTYLDIEKKLKERRGK